MVFGRIFQAASDEAKKESDKRKNSFYWVKCPACRRSVVKKELIRKGCYICGWRGTEEDVGSVEFDSVNKQGKVSSLDKKLRHGSYRIRCPHCGRQVIKKELEQKGCFICGYKPEDCP